MRERGGVSSVVRSCFDGAVQSFFLLAAAAVLLVGALGLGLFLIISRRLAAWSEASGGRGWGPTAAVLLGVGVVLGGASEARETRLWQETLTERSSPVVQLLPPGVECGTCRWEGYQSSLSRALVPLGIALVVGGLLVVPSWRWRWRAARSPAGESSEGQAASRRGSPGVRLAAEAALLASALVALVAVLWPPAGMRWWPADDLRWTVAQGHELASKGAEASGCALFWSDLELKPGPVPPLDEAMPEGGTLRQVLGALTERCLSSPGLPRGQPSKQFFGGAAWASVSPGGQERWLSSREASMSHCDALAEPFVQCVLAPRERARWQARARYCLKEKGCHPYNGGSSLAVQILTLGHRDGVDERCGEHLAYLERLASDAPQAPMPSGCAAR